MGSRRVASGAWGAGGTGRGPGPPRGRRARVDPQPHQPQLPAQRAAGDQVSRALGVGGGGRTQAAARPRVGWGYRPAEARRGLPVLSRPSRPLTAPHSLRASGLALLEVAQEEKGPPWGDLRGARRVPCLSAAPRLQGPSPACAGESRASDATVSDKEA